MREYNAQGPNHALAIMLDTKGPEVRGGKGFVDGAGMLDGPRWVRALSQAVCCA